MADFSDDELERYSRQIILREVAGPGQVKLRAARVLIIGAGGLGAPLASYLAGAGIGHLTIVDDDCVDLSNLQRQTFFTSGDIGAPKAEVMAARLRALNPDIRVDGVQERVSLENIDSLIADHDLVADGCDNFTTRLLVSDAAVRAGVTLVSAAIASYEGQLATFKSHAGDNLPCYRCFIPSHPGEGAEESCAEMGVLGPVAGVLGSMQAFEVIREILGLDGSLAGKLRLVNVLHGTSRTIALPKDPACLACGG